MSDPIAIIPKNGGQDMNDIVVATIKKGVTLRPDLIKALESAQS